MMRCKRCQDLIEPVNCEQQLAPKTNILHSMPFHLDGCLSLSALRLYLPFLSSPPPPSSIYYSAPSSSSLQLSLPHSPSRHSGASSQRTSPVRSLMMTVSSGDNAADTKISLTGSAPLEAVLFDVDGTLCDSDPIHLEAFKILFQEIGYNAGVPIDEQYYIEHFAGKHNEELAEFLFPDDIPRGVKFMEDKETMFRKLAEEKLKAIDGLYKLQKWIEDRGLKRVAVTNAPKTNAEFMISRLGLSDFFEGVILGEECEHAKPHPEPYLKGLELLKVSKEHAIIFEDSVSGIKAGVAAGMPVIGLTTRNPEHILMQAKPTFLIKTYDDPKLWAALEELDKKST
ncbi:haloacid dehalogenase-like hydrolase domain-containing protein Sgpp isoform X2 [Punica granatum]|uniref:Haloacid dehalogenase-like hydrolase domain-containing protein Sgpp isoform X2 n=2 Tax=Punica granatum TaxID=22663 RepID=A0A6P8C782_PUNGR|nr:haloacid dehalogenase-like hydrolase domain-containing protein Sgpp isoform X2 [Punica granatum]